MKKILVFSGAGISAESGISTFRDNNGLWNEYAIEDVATFAAWKRDIETVLDFYNMRRAELKNVQPNLAHQMIADLYNDFDVKIVTQNVDDLHERAGAKDVIHLHGELLKVRSTLDKNLIYKWEKDLLVGDKCEKGSQLRPHIVWFGEELNNNLINNAEKIAQTSDFCIIIGTSMQVYPAAYIPELTPDSCKVILIDPNANEIKLQIPESRVVRINDTAVKGISKAIGIIKAD